MQAVKEQLSPLKVGDTVRIRTVNHVDYIGEIMDMREDTMDVKVTREDHVDNITFPYCTIKLIENYYEKIFKWLMGEE